MRTFTAVIERDPETGLYVGYVPGMPGAHTQAETPDELDADLREVLELLFEEGEPRQEGSSWVPTPSPSPPDVGDLPVLPRGSRRHPGAPGFP